ncbi:MAG: type II toxin-antitoxin system PemK/MazF family toxin [Chloroflexota bacterium]|nr:type II toxin-antitoxin system PemK/MazF family toxin [Chloroflexota bacterium]
MTKRPNPPNEPQRGEIWIVNFNSPVTARTPAAGTPRSQWPTTGDEINKARPAVVLSVDAEWERELHIVVPLRGWQRRFEANNYFWISKLEPDSINKLRGISGADAFQVKSVSRERFHRKIGVLSPDHLRFIVDTVAFCIGAASLNSNS